MVEQPVKRAPANLPTWWHRGPSGLVEEWETRVPEEEITKRQDRWRPTPSKNANPQKATTAKP
ncbi:MAG: hypothetical protein OEY91_04890 [Nitrospirota bacterium]|nr:hypothetical protein [Nitrospirota bacterium]